MMKLFYLGLALMLLSISARASVLAECSRQSEGHRAVTACLEQAYQQAELQLGDIEQQVQDNMAELDAISSAEIGAEKAFVQSLQAFREWREQQCQFVRASYGSGNGAGQGYLGCMHSLSVEQAKRLSEYANSPKMSDQINLNLLRTLQVLLDECHVSRAAERLYITQSAVSRQLNQLRELFKDPLLVREGNRLLPTPKAEQLKPKLGGLLAECQSLFASDEFEPASWQGKAVLASSDYVAQYILPDIVEQLQQQAPQLCLTYQLWSPVRLGQLAELDIQLVSTMLPEIPKGLCGCAIGADNPVCVMRRDHPLAEKETLSVDDFVHYSHLRVSGGGDKDSFVDSELAEQGLERTIQFSVPFFSSAFHTLCRTDMLMVIPEHIAFNMKRLFPISYKALPIAVPEHKYWLLWHPRFDNDPAHAWLRELVLNVMRGSMYSISMSRNHNHDDFF